MKIESAYHGKRGREGSTYHLLKTQTATPFTTHGVVLHIEVIEVRELDKVSAREVRTR